MQNAFPCDKISEELKVKRKCFFANLSLHNINLNYKMFITQLSYKDPTSISTGSSSTAKVFIASRIGRYPTRRDALEERLIDQQFPAVTITNKLVTIFLVPVHLQMLPSNTSSISCFLGFGFSFKKLK